MKNWFKKKSQNSNQYYNGDRAEPLFWEGLVMGNGIANSLNKATNSVVNTGKTLSSQAESYLGNFANKYPKTYETVISGSVATGFDIYNKEESLEKTGFNFMLSRLLIGKNFGTQMSINIGTGIVLSTNDKEKYDKKILQQTTGEAVGTTTSFGIDSILSRSKIGNVSKPFISNFMGGISKNIINNEEDNKNIGGKDEK